MSPRNGQIVDNAPSLQRGHSLLELIRQKETDLTRELAAARETAVQKLEEARGEARRTIEQATVDGRHEGEAARRESLKLAEQEAEAIMAGAREEAQRLRSLEEDSLKEAAQTIIAALTGIKR